MERVGEQSNTRAYVDPADGATLYRCLIHGRISISPDGTTRLEATA